MRIILAVLLLAFAASASALSCNGTSLTRGQMDVLKAAVLADPTASGLAQVADDQGVASWLNATASPQFVIWKTRVTEQEMHSAYVWTEMDNLTQARFNALTLLLKPGFINPAITNVRQGVADIFAGASLASTRSALTALAKRDATRAERLLATGTGSTASPGTPSCDGSVTPQEASTILRG